MKEFVTADGRTFECENVTTGLNSITMTMENQDADDLEAFFRGVTELTVAFEGEEEPHGVYTEPQFSLAYKCVTRFEDGTSAVTMHIKNETERRLDALEKTQKIQDGAIMELAENVGGEA